MPRTVDIKKFKKAQTKRTLFCSILIFTIIPLTILVNCFLLGNQKYIIISLLVLLEIILPFFMVFEKRRPRAREIVMIGILSAITIIGNLVSFSILPVQFGTAMVIITGIAFGPETGFLVGALSRFISNFFLGQGTFTPWQMFSWGILGFIAGLAFNKIVLSKVSQINSKETNAHFSNKAELLQIMVPLISIIFMEIAAYISYLILPLGETTFWGWRPYIFGGIGLVLGTILQRRKLPANHLSLCIFTFFTVFIIYGGIMNICALVTQVSLPGGNDINFSSLKAYFISGFPYDLIHAGKAAFCILIFGKNMLQKLERVKLKYGFYK